MADGLSGTEAGKGPVRLRRGGPAVRARIIIEELNPHDKAAFEAFYSLYETCFPMADEREPPEAFDEIFSSNQDIRTQERYGPYREFVAVVRLWTTGPVIGGHVFGVVTSPEHLAAGFPASIQVIYTFLHKDYRGLVPTRMVINYSKAVALKTFPTGAISLADPIIFFEVNNPSKMTEEEIRQDTQMSGISPYRRYNFWLRSGFRPLAFPYVQPRLRPTAQPVRCLDLFCSASVGEYAPAQLLHSHLRSFVFISVLKNQDLSFDQDFQLMEKFLLNCDHVALMPPKTATLRSLEGSGARGLVS
jgi:hypothetical protein